MPVVNGSNYKFTSNVNIRMADHKNPKTSKPPLDNGFNLTIELNTQHIVDIPQQKVNVDTTHVSAQ